MPDAEFTLYTSGSSFVKEGKKYAGEVVVMEGEDIWAETLPPWTWPRRQKLITLTKALRMKNRQSLDIRHVTSTWCYISKKGTSDS